MVEQAEVRVVRCGGSKINYREAIISNDSKFLLCASGDSVKVYSTNTEECVHILQGHTDLVTGIAFNPINHLQVYSCSVDGTVRLWDYTDGILIKTLFTGHKIIALYVSKKHEGIIFVTVPMASKTDSEAFQLVAIHLPKTVGQEVEVNELSSVLTDISPAPKTTCFGREGEYIAFVKGLQLSVHFFRKQKTYRFFLKANDKKGAKNAFTCVSCHPKEDCIATGHEDGKIRLWRNFNQKKEYTYSTHHWHHDAVSALSFTPEGTSLLSGGIESVLVLWQYGTESKDFLPRLGSAIEHISVSPDGTLYCTSHRNNKITVINSNLKVSAVIQGLVGRDVKTDLTIDPHTKSLVLNGEPGHLQFYSLHHDKQLYSLDIVQQEHIHQSGLEQCEVVKAVFHDHGTWLATVEERREIDSEVDTSLKLWAYNEMTQSFELNTNISSPHEDRITAMCFSTDTETTLLVTTSKDGHFKAWQLAKDWESQGDGTSWSCDFVGSYHHLRPTSCCFSADGSVLAVGFQEIVTVWSPDSWEICVTLCQPPGEIRDLCFGRLSCSRYLLGTTSKNLLCCWNLLTCSLEWSTSIDVTLLLSDPLSENMAAFVHTVGNSDLFVFKPSEPRPLYSQKAVCPGKVHRAVFTPRDRVLENCGQCSQWLNRSQLYFITEHMDLMTFSTKSEEDRVMASSKQLVIDDSVAMTPFYLLLGKHRQQKQSSVTNQTSERVHLPQVSSSIRELLHTPSHVLPSAAVLCSMFVNSLLISSTDTSFELNTNISSPHEDRITAMCFSTDTETTLLVTTSKDGHFKAWQLAKDWESQGDGTSWSCDFVGSYHHLWPTSCCFSADGSVLAIGFQEIVTVWSPDTWEICVTLCQPPGKISNGLKQTPLILQGPLFREIELFQVPAWYHLQKPALLLEPAHMLIPISRDGSEAKVEEMECEEEEELQSEEEIDPCDSHPPPPGQRNAEEVVSKLSKGQERELGKV